LDTTFGDGGIVTTEFAPHPGGCANAVAIQRDGKIVAAGTQHNGTFQFALARYQHNGTLHPTFGNRGKVTTKFNKPSSEVHAIAIDRAGRIVAVGEVMTHRLPRGPFPGGVPYLTDFAVARYLPNGRLDDSFGLDGTTTTDIGRNDSADVVAIQPNGKLIAGGSVWEVIPIRFALARYRC
jgi:uncharacterized delta-60 repeat protein